GEEESYRTEGNERCKQSGRDPSSLRHSVMANYLSGRDADDLSERALKMAKVVPRMKKDSAAEIVQATRQSAFVGTPEEVAGQIREFAKLGVELFMLQHFLLDDRDALELLSNEVIPAVA